MLLRMHISDDDAGVVQSEVGVRGLSRRFPVKVSAPTTRLNPKVHRLSRVMRGHELRCGLKDWRHPSDTPPWRHSRIKYFLQPHASAAMNSALKRSGQLGTSADAIVGVYRRRWPGKIGKSKKSRHLARDIGRWVPVLWSAFQNLNLPKSPSASLFLSLTSMICPYQDES